MNPRRIKRIAKKQEGLVDDRGVHPATLFRMNGMLPPCPNPPTLNIVAGWADWAARADSVAAA